MFQGEEMSIIQSGIRKQVFFKSAPLGKTFELRLPTACIRVIGVRREIKSLRAKTWCYLPGSSPCWCQTKAFLLLYTIWYNLLLYLLPGAIKTCIWGLLVSRLNSKESSSITICIGDDINLVQKDGIRKTLWNQPKYIIIGLRFP